MLLEELHQPVHQLEREVRIVLDDADNHQVVVRRVRVQFREDRRQKRRRRARRLESEHQLRENGHDQREPAIEVQSNRFAGGISAENRFVQRGEEQKEELDGRDEERGLW